MRTILPAALLLLSGMEHTHALCDDLAQDVKCMYENDIPATLGSYNSLQHQVAFCKMQGYDTFSRNTSAGPSVFTSGLVKMGVGLAHAQFGSTRSPSWLDLPEGAAACGMCIEVTSVKNMPEIDSELLSWDYANNISVPFIAMIFDQCTDPICQSGYLDFDVYDQYQPVQFGNPFDLEWRAVDCPVGDEHKFEYLFCVPGTCNAQDEDLPEFGEKFDSSWFTLVVRNQRIPLIKVEIQIPGSKEFNSLNFVAGAGWVWQGETYDTDLAKAFKIRLTSADGQVKIETIPHKDVLDVASTPGYRGGVLVTGKEQFGPSHF